MYLYRMNSIKLIWYLFLHKYYDFGDYHKGITKGKIVNKTLKIF